MSKKSICITVLFLSLYIFSFSQLTIVGTEVTLSGDVLLYSDDDVINVDSSAEIKVLGNSQLICSDSLENNGVINSYGSIVVDSYLSGSANASFSNQGELSIRENFNALKGSYTGQGDSKVIFINGGKHSVSSTNENSFRTMVISEGDVVLNTDVLSRNIQFIADKIICNGNTLLVSNDISGYGDNSYVVGLLARVVKSGDYVMPIGASNYRPAKLMGVTDSTVFFIKVSEGGDNLNQYGELKEVDEGIVWDYSFDSNTYANLNSTLSIGVAYDVNELTVIGSDTSNHRVAISDTFGSGYYSYGQLFGNTISNGLSTLYSTDSIPSSGFLSVGEICSLNEFSVSAFLQGPYNQTTGLMNTSSVINQELKAMYEFGGTNEKTMREGYGIPSNAIDIIQILLRDSSNSFTTIDTSDAWLVQDGSIRDFETGFKSTVGFCDITSPLFYLQVEHRNHLPIMSAITYSNLSPITSVNLTIPENIYGVGYATSYNSSTFNNDGLMYCGDNRKSASNVVNAIDYFQVINDISPLKTGYLDTDLDLNGETNSADNDLGLENSSWLRKSTVR